MDDATKFQKLDLAGKRLGLSTYDMAVLLQVTPAMVSRYRGGKVGKIGQRDKDKFSRASAALKALIPQRGELADAQPRDRLSLVVDAMRSTSTGGEVKVPMFL